MGRIKQSERENWEIPRNVIVAGLRCNVKVTQHIDSNTTTSEEIIDFP